MLSTTMEVSAITRAPREVCRSGHCAQPSIHQLATAVDPATAAGGAAAAACGPGAQPAPGCCRRPGHCWRPGRRRRRQRRRSCDGINFFKFIALDRAFPSDYEQAAAAGMPAPARGSGPAGNKRNRVRYRETQSPDIVIKIYDIGTLDDSISGLRLTRYRDIWSRYRYIPILVPISGFTISGHTRYRETRYRVCSDIGIPDIGT